MLNIPVDSIIHSFPLDPKLQQSVPPRDYSLLSPHFLNRPITASSRSLLGEFYQICSRCNAQYKPPSLIRNNRELLLAILPTLTTIEKQLQLLQWRLHRNDFINLPLSPKLDHSFRYLI